MNNLFMFYLKNDNKLIFQNKEEKLIYTRMSDIISPIVKDDTKTHIYRLPEFEKLYNNFISGILISVNSLGMGVSIDFISKHGDISIKTIKDEIKKILISSINNKENLSLRNEYSAGLINYIMTVKQEDYFQDLFGENIDKVYYPYIEDCLEKIILTNI